MTRDVTGATPANRLLNLGRWLGPWGLLILTIPIWWVMGLDHAIWLLGAFLLGGFALRRPALQPFGVAALLFYGVLLLSGLLGAEGTRWITFARDAVIVAAFLLAIVGAARLTHQPGQVHGLVFALACVILVSSVGSMIAFVLRDPLQFTTPIAPFVPDTIAETRLGEVSLTTRILGTLDFFAGIRLLRPQGLFIFATSQALALAVAIPVLMAARSWIPWLRWPLLALAGLASAVLVITTTRGAILALVAAALGIWLLRRWTIGNIVIPLNLRSGAVMVAGMSLIVAVSLITGAATPVIRLFTTRSFDTRSSLYEETLSFWAERPILGWGTEVDYEAPPTPKPTAKPTPKPTPSPTAKPSPTATPEPRPGDNPPLGSHSQYLGVLFKQGLVGAMLFVALSAVLATHAVRLFRSPRPGTDWLVIAFAASLIGAITESLWLDPATAVIIAIAWGLVLGLGRKTEPPRLDRPQNMR